MLTQLDERFRKELETGWEVNFDEVAAILKVKKESLMRMIRKLADNGSLEYRPPFRGTEINILKRVPKEELRIDFKALKEKLKHAYGKLNKIEDYVYHLDCRPQFILKYFGDNKADICNICDNCLVLKGYERKAKAPQYKPKKKAKKPKTKLATKLTQLETFDLYNKGMNIKEMAEARGVKEQTIINHLCYLVEKGLPVDINKYVTAAKQRKILKAVSEVGADKLKPIKEQLGDEVKYDEIKLTLAKNKHG
jgi:ATP-dependent DNA helicase RecQ